jgi:hypothetical protein
MVSKFCRNRGYLDDRLNDGIAKPAWGVKYRGLIPGRDRHFSLQPRPDRQFPAPTPHYPVQWVPFPRGQCDRSVILATQFCPLLRLIIPGAISPLHTSSWRGAYSLCRLYTRKHKICCVWLKHAYIHTCMHAFIHTCVCAYVRTHIRTCTRTHAHTCCCGVSVDIFVGRQESFSQGIGGVQTGFLGLGVPLGTNRLVIVRCGFLDRETVELITKHRTLVLFQ